MFPVPLNIPGLSRPLSMYTHGPADLHVSRRIREEGIWEPYETSLVLDILRSGDVFVDAGANIGYFSLLAASVVGEEGMVYAFEPEPDNFRLLRASAELNGMGSRIEAVRAGLAREDGAGRLYLSGDNLGDHQTHAGGAGRPCVPIEMIDGSAYLRGRISRLDLLKVDTQGAEFLVMAGLMPLLRELPTMPRILIELTPRSLRQAGSSGRELIELLAQTGSPMWIVDHLEHRLVASDAGELAAWCDDVDAVPEDEGFMNILVGEGPG